MPTKPGSAKKAAKDFGSPKPANAKQADVKLTKEQVRLHLPPSSSSFLHLLVLKHHSAFVTFLLSIPWPNAHLFKFLFV